MSVKTFLEKAGEDLLKVITFGAIAAKDAAPFIAIGDPALGALINGTATTIIAAQAAGSSAALGAPAADNGAQKSALVISAIGPAAIAYAKTIGANAPTQEQLQQWVDGFVKALQAFEVPASNTAAATPAGSTSAAA